MTAFFYRQVSPRPDLSGVFFRLPAGKRRALARLRRRADFLRSLTVYGLLEEALNQTVEAPPALGELDWSLGGRPRFPSRPGLWISLSHGGDAAVCALGDAPVGVDVEPLPTDLEDHRGLAGAMGFAPCPSPEDFLRLWLLWESYLKFSGRPLSPSGLRAVGGGDAPALMQGEKLLPARFLLRAVGERALVALCFPPAETANPPLTLLP